jgi:TolA-binding protein
MKLWQLGLLVLGVASCASRGQVRKVETQLAMMAREQERRDSTHAAQLKSIIDAHRLTIDSLEAIRRQISVTQGENSAAFIELGRRLVQLQELAGQSQQQLNTFYNDLDTRRQALEASGYVDSAGGPPPGVTSAEQLYAAAQDQLRQLSYETARSGFNELVRLYPMSPRVADAFYGIAETYSSSKPDSAAAYYRDVTRNFPESPAAGRAFYKLGFMADRSGDSAAAKAWYQRAASDRFRGTPEYDLAAEALRRLP